MKTIRIKVTYLEMLRRPERKLPAPPEGTRIIWAHRPAVAFYRFLYNTVGKEWNWIDRQLMSDERLGKIIHDGRVEIYVLYVQGTPAGFAELDRRIDDDIELAYFGVMPEFTGKGLGRYLLDWTIEKAWSHDPRRLWLHTCELDHEAALPMYLKAGFEVFDQRVVEQVVL